MYPTRSSRARSHSSKHRGRCAVVGLTILATAAIGVGAGPTASVAVEDDPTFQRVASFPVYRNLEAAGLADAETVAEIVAVTTDGETLLSTDSPGEQIGFTDISDPSNPQPLGTFPVGGEPTSVAINGDYALVAVNTSESFVDPSGTLVVLDVSDPTSPKQVRTLTLAGQPDSIKVSPSGTYAAIVIENERDEDLGDGEPPQAPGGVLQILNLTGAPNGKGLRTVKLAGVADVFPSDPEPEFVDINENDLAVVTLQENNHIILVDLKTGRIKNDFSAGMVDLTGIDALDDRQILLTDTLDDVPREPDAVTWIDENRFATANEGDLYGGSRGFTVFDTNGTVLYDSGSDFDQLAVRHGHYPDRRSDAKGTEPESIESATYDGVTYLFVGSERGSFVAVYEVPEAAETTEADDPMFVQFLPAGLGPEGLLAIPEKDLFIASTEEDSPPFGVRATIGIFELGTLGVSYPDIVSDDDAAGTPIPWGALSGLTTDPSDSDIVYAVWDSFYRTDSRVFTIDVAQTPAAITASKSITDNLGPTLDPEGVAIDGAGAMWIASEGNAADTIPNRLVRLNTDGSVAEVVGLPAEVLECRAAERAAPEASRTTATLGSGFEGLTVLPDGRIMVAQQRGWNYTTDGCTEIDDTPGMNAAEPTSSRLWIHDPATASWSHLPYALDPKPANASWIGLSEVTVVGTDLVFIERDNRTGDYTETKNLVVVSIDDALVGGVSLDEKAMRYDLIGPLEATNGWITDKPEGFTVAGDDAYVVTDNDGVDDWSGETQLLRIPLEELFPPAG